MKINIIAAMDKNNAIGGNNKLLWHYPDDLAHFKKMTMNKTVVMGRKTYESIKSPLEGRRKCILSEQKSDNPDWFTSITELIDKLYNECIDEIFIIGGATLYNKFMIIADTLYITIVPGEYTNADTYFPIINQASFKLDNEEAVSVSNGVLKFQIWNRNRK